MLDVPESFNIAVHLLDRNVAAGRGEHVAIRCEGRQVTYRQLQEMTHRAGNALRGLGVRWEERVLLVLPDSPEFAAAYLGTMEIGAVAVPCNTMLGAADYAYFLDESRARVLVTAAGLFGQVQPALAGRPHLEHVVVVGEAPAGTHSWDEWVGRAPAELEAAPTHRDDVAFWLWTSGSTGRPKAAVHLHHDWVYCCEYYARGILDMGPDDVCFSSSKLFHAYGLGNGLAFPFHVGATAVHFPGRPTPAAVLEVAHAQRPTLFFSVPTLYAAMLHHTDQANPYDLSCVRLCASAAEPLPADVFRRWRERFHGETLDGIGSTEVLHIYVSPRPGQVRPGSSGKPVPGYDVLIADEDGRPLPPGQVGDLLVRGESTAPYYWHRHSLSQQRMRGDFFFTGDKYLQDQDGYFWYVGRADDMFKVGGEWVSPIEVENALITHPAVLESAVVPWLDADQLLKPKAFVVLKDPAKASPQLASELQELVRSQLPRYTYPRWVEFVADLPKTAAGKIQRYILRAGQGLSAGQ